MANSAASPATATVSGTDADQVLAACRLLVSISVRSANAVEDEVTLPQLRMLVAIASHGPTTLSALAAATGQHLSNASRACDRMVASGWVTRNEHPADRRRLQISLTPAGRRIVTKVSDARRRMIMPILRRMPASGRVQLVAALTEFAEAGGEPTAADLWSLGWTT
ncbi:MAG TPA: MarR family winged helix-turn-helix transcriptional regulator [Jatrophihabitantaceae bacterium]|jgi:DNA-binding MarR family transcriptional regulator|nr:MarR family winged helix-turn-helix transcriptional regulator [Jatrophihabitantaceae bacterium]